MANETRHIELYKAYRPTNWAGLIGQAKVAKSLQMAVRSNKLPTAYLFSGPRGTGKTSAALLLAKAINCLNPNENHDPCNTCEVCENIDAGRQLGVSYLSAANTGSVDEVRKLVQQARLHQPIKQQVWIIDEVHNLSKQGFDALLIPLEEKGMPALFIFCTTEISKVPQTIISRIQARKFNLVDPELMLRYAKHIGSKEGLELSDDEYAAAVRDGRGSVRDTLTALEAIMSSGITSTSVGGKLVEALAVHDLPATLTVIAQANADGETIRDLAEQLFEDLRNLLLHSVHVDSSLVGVLAVSDPDKVVKGFVSREGLMAVMDMLGESLTHMAMGGDARIHLEIACVKAVDQLKRRRKALEARG